MQWSDLISYGLPYPEASVHHLPRHNSDRSRILSSLSRSIPAREIWPFDILAAWMQHADFKQIINDAWRANDSSIVDAIDSITDATKDLLEKISSNIDVYFKRKRCLLDRINGIQKYLIIKWRRHPLFIIILILYRKQFLIKTFLNRIHITLEFLNCKILIKLKFLY